MIWDKKEGAPQVVRYGLTSDEYQQASNSYTAQGYRTVHVTGCGYGNKAFYAAIWEKKDGPAWVARHAMNGTQYQSEFDKYTGQGYKLVRVSGYVINGKDYYAAIWNR